VKPTTIAVVGPRAREIGELMKKQGAFEMVAEVNSFTQLLLDPGFPTRYVIIEEGLDRDCTEARIAISQSLGARVVLVAAGTSPSSHWAADLVVAGQLTTDAFASMAQLEAEVRRTPAEPAAPRALTPITAREREALDLWAQLGRIPMVADQLGVKYTTAATLIKRARKKLRTAPVPA